MERSAQGRKHVGHLLDQPRRPKCRVRCSKFNPKRLFIHAESNEGRQLLRVTVTTAMVAQKDLVPSAPAPQGLPAPAWPVPH